MKNIPKAETEGGNNNRC